MTHMLCVYSKLALWRTQHFCYFDCDILYPERPAQEATPHSEGTIELTGQVKPLPTSKPGGESEEHTHRTHEEEITAIYLEGKSPMCVHVYICMHLA